MKTKSSQIQHLKGEQAYVLYWEQVYKCRPRLQSIKAIDLNLEIITDENQALLAYRYDPPDDMLGMEIDNGLWCLHEEDCLGVEVIQAVKSFIARIRIGNSVN